MLFWLPSSLLKVPEGWGAGLCCRGCTHHPPTAVVVQVHQCPGILHLFLLGIHEGFGEADPVVDVVAAAAPVELPALVLGAAPLERVTAAHLEVPLAAGPRDGIDHPGRGDGVDEGGLPAACRGTETGTGSECQAVPRACSPRGTRAWGARPSSEWASQAQPSLLSTGPASASLEPFRIIAMLRVRARGAETSSLPPGPLLSQRCVQAGTAPALLGSALPCSTDCRLLFYVSGSSSQLFL